MRRKAFNTHTNLNNKINQASPCDVFTHHLDINSVSLCFSFVQMWGKPDKFCGASLVVETLSFNLWGDGMQMWMCASPASSSIWNWTELLLNISISYGWKEARTSSHLAAFRCSARRKPHADRLPLSLKICHRIFFSNVTDETSALLFVHKQPLLPISLSLFGIQILFYLFHIVSIGCHSWAPCCFQEWQWISARIGFTCFVLSF